MPEIEPILNKEMTRKQFLTSIGLAIVSLFGITALIGSFAPEEPPARRQAGDLPGYGLQNYGP